MKFAACQEMFEGWSFDKQCTFLAETGYQGVEVAPFTLSKPVDEFSAVDRRVYVENASTAGLEIIGLHWLLAKTEGYYLNHPDSKIREITAKYLGQLAELCADLGGKILVLGSPLQRNITPSLTKTQAEDFARDTISQLLPTLEKTDTVLCLEPLGRKETDFWNRCEECAQTIAHFSSPHIRLHQDVKAMLDEPTEIPELIHQYKDLTAHFHVNDANLLGPGMGETDYHPILKALTETNYNGWVSLEVFDYSPGSEHIARVSLEHLKDVLRALET